MSVKYIAVDGIQLIDLCIKEDKRAQRLFYERYAPDLLGICRRYLSDPSQAEDAMIQALFKILTSLRKLNEKEKLWGWMKRIAVNECLMILRKKKMKFVEEEQLIHISDKAPSVQDKLQADEILRILDHMPAGYRTIFNLYVIEGFKHREIAEQLGISINTSKSQLIMARKKLQQIITKKETGTQ